MLMALVSFSAVFTVSYDSDAIGEDERNATSIVGGDRCAIYKGASGITAIIDFNQGAFSDNATITFKAGTTGSYTAICTTNDETKITTTTSPVAIGDTGLSMTIVPVSDDKGKYIVGIAAGSSSTNGNIDLFIELTVTDKIDSTAITLPSQKYYFKAELSVDDAPKIQFSGSNVTQDGSGNYSVDVYQELNVNVEASLSSGTAKYYAVNLPSGLSMTVSGIIGGKLEATVSVPSTVPVTVYAITDGNLVLSTYLTININESSSSNVDYTVSLDTGVGSLENNYIVATNGDNVILSVSQIANTKLTDVTATWSGGNSSVSVSGANDSYSVNLSVAGTGTGELKIGGYVSTDGKKPVFVEKTYTVYVVGSIVSADLDPTVSTS